MLLQSALQKAHGVLRASDPSAMSGGNVHHGDSHELCTRLASCGRNTHVAIDDWPNVQDSTQVQVDPICITCRETKAHWLQYTFHNHFGHLSQARRQMFVSQAAQQSVDPVVLQEGEVKNVLCFDSLKLRQRHAFCLCLNGQGPCHHSGIWQTGQYLV